MIEEEKVDVNSRDKKKNTGLRKFGLIIDMASANGLIEIVKYLVD